MHLALRKRATDAYMYEEKREQHNEIHVFIGIYTTRAKTPRGLISLLCNIGGTRRIALVGAIIGNLILQNRPALGLHICRNLLDGSPNTKVIETRNLSGILVADTTPQQLSNDIGVFGDILETFRLVGNPIKIGANANVVIPDEITDVHDVLNNFGKSALARNRDREAIIGAHILTGKEQGTDIDVHNRICLLDKLQDVIRNVPGMWADTVNRAVREDSGGAGAFPAVLAR